MCTVLRHLLALACTHNPTAAQHAQHLPYFDTNLIVMEMENFSVAADSAWVTQPWLQNRFAASVADTYLSRRAYLHGPANISASSSATMTFDLSEAEAGCYDVLLRYESAFNFETPVHVSITKALQPGTPSPSPLFERIYGQRNSLKVFPFGSARLGPFGNGTGQSMCGPGRPPTDFMQAECWWPYGSTEQIVWEGVGANITLDAGSYTVTVVGETDTGIETPAVDGIPTEFADRNLDVLVLSRNHSDIRMRVQHPPLVLPLDGLLTQGGEVFMRVHNHNTTEQLNLTVPFVTGHSIYYDTHLRLPLAPATPGAAPTSSCTHAGVPLCPVIAVPAGGVSDWVDVGGLMDTFNHGQWSFQFGNYSLQIGVLSSAGDGAIDTIGTFNSQGSSLYLLFDANTRASRRIRERTEDVYAVAALLDTQTETMVPGRLPTEVPFFGTFFQPVPMTTAIAPPGTRPHKPEPAVCPRCGAEYREMFKRIHSMFSGPGPSGVQPTDFIERNSSGLPKSDAQPFKFGYIDVRQFITPWNPDGLAAAVGASNSTFDPPYIWPRTDQERASIRVVSLGDEITIASPVPTDTDNASFATWAQGKGLVPADVGCTQWGPTCLPDAVTVPAAAGATTGQCGMYYYASRFLNDMGIRHYQRIVQLIQKFLPNAGIGANYSPTEFKTDTRDGQQYCNAYLGNAFQWLRNFKEGASTLPWSEGRYAVAVR